MQKSADSRAKRGRRAREESLGASTVCSPASSEVKVELDLGTDSLMKISSLAKERNVMWVKIKGHPYWPAQLVEHHVTDKQRFEKAKRFRRKGEDSCVMYFGTCEVAYVNQAKSCVSFAEGVKRNLHQSQRSRAMFQRALAEVKAFCARNIRYPRGWWNEPEVMARGGNLVERCMGENVHENLKEWIDRADIELIHWAKVRGFPHWPVQVLPRNMARDVYPQLRLSAISNGMTTNVPCIFFGTGEVMVISEKHLTPFGAGLARGYVSMSDRLDFTVALGEMWGYLQVPRIWPDGYLSGIEWWNYKETQEVAKMEVENDNDVVLVPHLPKYVHVRKSVWAEGVEALQKPKKGDASHCDCIPTDGEQCCTDQSCLNFASRYFCNAVTCKGGQLCGNIPFHKRKSPKMKPFFTADQRGWGLRVEEPIKTGTFVVEYVGEIINRKVLEDRLKQMQQQNSSEYYMMDLANDLLVDAKFKGNLSRFINSSCEPNCQTQKWTDSSTGQTHVGIFAIQDIPVGTELTYNYCFQDFGLAGKTRKRSFMCQCGTSSCLMLEPVERKLMKKLMGKRIEVQWDDGWYPGVVELYNLNKKKFRVQYDDGDCEDLDLGNPLSDGDGVSYRLVDEQETTIASDAK